MPLFGGVFGFLLQKSSVGRHEVLIGQFLLTDFTVVKVMLTAIIVGMLGLMAGSCFHTETSGCLGSTIRNSGNRGGIKLPDLLGMRLDVFLAVFVPLLVVGLLVMVRLAP